MFGPPVFMITATSSTGLVAAQSWFESSPQDRIERTLLAKMRAIDEAEVADSQQ